MGIYLNEEYLEEHGGARNRYLKMQVEKEKKAIDDLKKSSENHDNIKNEYKSSRNLFTKAKLYKKLRTARKEYSNTFGKAEAIQSKNRRYTGKDLQDLAADNNKRYVSYEPTNLLDGRFYKNERAFSNVGKKRFNKDFGGPNKGRDYETYKLDSSKYPHAAQSLNKNAIKANLKRKGLIKEACEYILDMLDEEYYYDEYED